MDYLSSYREWLAQSELTDSQKTEIERYDEKAIKEAFWQPLEFGTAGMRGIIAMGTNRMNEFTVRRATKGLADYITELGSDAKARGVVISYDTRRYSAYFAAECAKVLSANGIKCYLFEDVRPVPICSFAIRNYNAAAGIMITASHNPKEYNGYKVYGDDGAQMSPDATAKVVEYISASPYFGIARANVDLSDIKGKDNFRADENITVVGKSLDEKYFEAIEKVGLSPEAVAKYGGSIKIVYTPVHGSGYMPVTSVLKRMGITVNVVEAQAVPDCEFSTVRVPNPEEADTLKLGVELADKIGSDVVIGTDPDADRMGIAIRDDKDDFTLLNGNQIGVLLADYIMLRKTERGEMPDNGALVKTIVTTELARDVATGYGATTFDVLTGFKFIGEKIKEWETSGEYVYLFGFEESYGSLVGTHARDKDAVVAAMLFAEMICYYESKGVSIYTVLQNIYAKYGYYCEKAISVAFGGVDGMEKMKNIMQSLRTSGISDLNGIKVVLTEDFKSGESVAADGTVAPIPLPKTDALKIKLENGDWVCARPSGTEPKLKIYASAKRENAELALTAANAYLDEMKTLAK